MSKKPDQYMQRANEALAFLRQKVDAVLKIADFSRIQSLSDLPEAKAKSVEEQLWGIVAYGEYYAAKVISDLGTPLPYVKGENFAFYENKYQSFIEKAKELIGASGLRPRQKIEIRIARLAYNLKMRAPVDADELAMPETLQNDINKFMPFYERLARDGYVRGLLLNDHKYNQEIEKIWKDHPREHFEDFLTDHRYYADKRNLEDSFGRIMDLVENRISGYYKLREDEDDFDDLIERVSDIDNLRHERFLNLENLKHEKFLSLDAWVANRKELSPIIASWELAKIPKHIRARVKEIYHSFIFGNWMSAIALSRCLLEYALIHRKSLLSKRLGREIEVRDPVSKQSKKISVLTSIAEEAFPQLKESMDLVTEYGHFVMHPDRKIVPSKNQAKKCIDEIGKIIGTLYGA